MSVLSNARSLLENLSDDDAVALYEAITDANIFGQGTFQRKPEGGLVRADPTRVVIATVRDRVWIDPVTYDFIRKSRDENRDVISVIVRIKARPDGYGIPIYLTH